MSCVHSLQARKEEPQEIGCVKGSQDAVRCCSELVRYRQFLGIQKEQQNIKEEQDKLKKSFAQGKDIVSPDNLNTISQTKAEGTPADR